MKKKYDRRVVRTRSFLFKALISLLNEKDFNQIKITELTDRADIARPTFYRNYNSIQDILLEELDYRADNYLEELTEMFSTCTCFSTMNEVLFRRWDDNRELFLAMYKAEMDNYILDRFVQYAEDMMNIVNQGKGVTNKYKLYYFAGGAHNLFKNWLISGRNAPVQELAQILASDLYPLVKNPLVTLAINIVGQN